MNRIGVVLIFALLSSTWMEAQQEGKCTDYSSASFSRLMKHVKWKWHPWNFQYPSFMADANFDETKAIDEYCGTLNLHTWGNVELCYWPFRSYTVAYPDKGTNLTPNAMVSCVTYSSKHKGIYSGYTEDGRIFYMKVVVLSGDDIDFSAALVLVYPKEYQGNIGKLIDMLYQWEYRGSKRVLSLTGTARRNKDAGLTYWSGLRRYPIRITPEGYCFIVKESPKSGKFYRVFLGRKKSRLVCNNIGQNI